MASYSEALDSLWRVQALDERIQESHRRIAAAERAMDRASQKLAAAEKAMNEAHDVLQHMRAKEKEHEDELARLDVRVKQLEGQGTEAGNAAAERQRAKIDEIESAGIELLSEIEAQTTVRETRRTQLDDARRVTESESAAARQIIEDEQAVLEDLIAKRDAESANVVPGLLEVYEAVHERRPGAALARVRGTYCGSCNGELTLHLVHQVKRRAEIVRCPICGCILDVDEPAGS